jgi:iron complex transport system substrate-binding protein
MIMRHSVLPVWTVFLAIAMLLSACRTIPDNVSTDGITITDSLDRKVILPAPPERIIIAGKANFMINDAVYLFSQAPDKVIGLTQAQQASQQFIALLDPGYIEKARFTLNSSAEEIAAAQPDLVLLKKLMQETLGQGLEQLNIPVIYLDLETPEQYQHDIAILGQIFDDPARADEIWLYYETLLDTLQTTLKDIPDQDRPTVLIIQYNSSGGEEAFQIPPSAWIQTQMAELAGGKPVWEEAAQGNWAVVNLEQIAAWDPQQIYILSYFENPENVVSALKNDQTWQQLSAVKNELLYGFPKDFYSWDQPDTRWGLGLTWLAYHIQPTLFADFDISHTFYQFYGELYGLDSASIEQHIIPLLQGERMTDDSGE